MNNHFTKVLSNIDELKVDQVFEAMEFLGLETRNRYKILTNAETLFAYAAEEKNMLGHVARQLFGHWRTFNVFFFDKDKAPLFRAHHPFRFFFERIEIYDQNDNLIGSIEQNFSLFRKHFTIYDQNDETLFEMKSPIFKIWTFPIYRGGEQLALIEKVWSTLLQETFTDKDIFMLKFLKGQSFSIDEKIILLVATIFIDLLYFEEKASLA
ncbi:MAG: hypothetical protein HQK52_18220 [Oligoflexia bacterium]|nr:hypothetical protein [Oligoflexia bacterium]